MSRHSRLWVLLALALATAALLPSQAMAKRAPTLTQSIAPHWAGMAVTKPQNSGPPMNRLETHLRVPSVTCIDSLDGRDQLVIWIGFGGIGGSDKLFQEG